MAQALGQMYRTNPKFPIDYLTKWLDNYCFQREFEKDLESGEFNRDELFKRYQKDLEEQRRIQKEHDDIEVKKQQELEELKNRIKDEEIHEGLLAELIPQEIFKRVDLTGVYIGLYAPQKQVIEDDLGDVPDGEQEVPTFVLQYVGGDSDSMVKPR